MNLLLRVQQRLCIQKKKILQEEEEEEEEEQNCLCFWSIYILEGIGDKEIWNWCATMVVLHSHD